MSVSSVILQVLLQTYIEWLRGEMEDKKKMNKHGRAMLVSNRLPSAPRMG